jgi:hypothetical protein
LNKRKREEKEKKKAGKMGNQELGKKQAKKKLKFHKAVA